MVNMFELGSFYRYFLLLLQLNNVISTSQNKYADEESSIFDPRVLHAVETLYKQRLHESETKKNGVRKSTIETSSDFQTGLHVKVDPRAFGQTLINRAEENAARKSDIYMNKAIDATALGVAVLKLIFGKDAKMVMKDVKNSDTQDASLRTKEFRPAGITSWSTPILSDVNAKRKSFLDKHQAQSGSGKQNGIAQLSKNIARLVKNFRKNEKNEETLTKSEGSRREKVLSAGKRNLGRLLRLIKENRNREEKGAKKSWVLLRVKQPHDEIGMLSDPSKSEQSEEENKAVLKITPKHEQRAEQRGLSNSKNFKNTEVKSLTSPIRSSLSSLKSEPVQEVNAVKTDRTSSSYDNSVSNLLSALELTSERSSMNFEPTKKFVNEKSREHDFPKKKLELKPVQKTEENAATKDSLNGAPGAVVSLDALRQLGQLLGLANQNSESRISPFTGTADTLTPAEPVGAEERLKELISSLTTPAPTVPPTVPPTPPIAATAAPVRYVENREETLNRISEQLKMFAERGLRSHNEYRGIHNAQPLKWSEDLASAAEKLAYQAAKSGSVARSNIVEQRGFGENVAKIPNAMLENAGEDATRHWYNEKQKFTFSDPLIKDETKSFTQLIWKGTKEIGMGAAKDDDTGELYVIALYRPKGNHEGTLRENIQSDSKEKVDVYASIFKKSTQVHASP